MEPDHQHRAPPLVQWRTRSRALNSNAPTRSYPHIPNQNSTSSETSEVIVEASQPRVTAPEIDVDNERAYAETLHKDMADLRELNAIQEGSIATQERTIAAKTRIIAARDRTIAARNQTIKEQEDTLAARDLTIAARDRTIEEQEWSLAAWKGIFDWQETNQTNAIAARDLTIAARDRIIEEQERSLRAWREMYDSAMATWEQTNAIAAREEEARFHEDADFYLEIIDDRDETIEDRDETIEGQEDTIMDQDEVIEYLLAVIAAQGDTIRALRGGHGGGPAGSDSESSTGDDRPPRRRAIRVRMRAGRSSRPPGL